MDGKDHERALDYVFMRCQFLKEHDLPESPLRIVRERLSGCRIILRLLDHDVLLFRTDVQLRDLQLLDILSVQTAYPAPSCDAGFGDPYRSLHGAARIPGHQLNSGRHQKSS